MIEGINKKWKLSNEQLLERYIFGGRVVYSLNGSLISIQEAMQILSREPKTGEHT